tara:strand:+ start:94 stop:699 length:606 start_codon:yes stop_codon:yes gene_type:complete
MYNPQYTRPSVLENKYLNHKTMTENDTDNHDQLPHTMETNDDEINTINRDEVKNIYDTQMLCTYQIELTKLTMCDKNDKEQEEEQSLKNMLYNVQLAQVFKVEDGTSVSSSYMLSQIERLYILIKDIEFIKQLISTNPYSYLFVENNKEEKEFLLFQTLFSYDYFHLFHKCMIYYFASTQANDNLKECILTLNTVMQHKHK